MKKKKKQKRSKKPRISLHRLVKITSRSLSKAYEDFKNKQKINKLKKIKLKKREEARGITKEKKELNMLIQQLKLSKIHLNNSQKSTLKS